MFFNLLHNFFFVFSSSKAWIMRRPRQYNYIHRLAWLSSTLASELISLRVNSPQNPWNVLNWIVRLLQMKPDSASRQFKHIFSVPSATRAFEASRIRTKKRTEEKDHILDRGWVHSAGRDQLRPIILNPLRPFSRDLVQNYLLFILLVQQVQRTDE